MGSRREKEAIVIVLDVGTNMKQLYEPNKTYLDASKECITQIIQRKVFSNSSDELGLILFGCEKTNNKLASEFDGYEHIDSLTDHLTLASWDLLRFIDAVEVSDCTTADWLDAIIVSVEFIKTQTELRNFSHQKIVVFSNFESYVSDDQIDRVINGIKEFDINVVVIGPDVQKNEYMPGKVKSETQTHGEILISNLIDKVNGIICPFEDALSELMYVQRKSTNPTPWNTLFHISKKIRIPISAFKKIAEVQPLKWISEDVDDTNAGVIRESAYMKMDDDREIQTEVPREDINKGYQFGTTIISFGESEENMRYQSGPRGLYLIGCTSKERVPLHILMGSGSYIVMGKKGDDVANAALNAFIEGLKENGAVGIARRVYNNNSAAMIGALFPVVTDDHRYLVYVELPYAEDEHVYKFSSLSDVNPSEEQLKEIDELMDEMNLDETDDHSEMYELTKNYDPREQFVLRCIAQKALYPDKPIDNDLFKVDFLKPQSEIIKSCQKTLEKIKELFPLTKVEPKKKKFNGVSGSSSNSANGVVKTDALFPQTSDIEIDLANPAEEFTALIKTGKPYLEVCNQMQNVIEQLLSISDETNLVKSLKAFRNNCINIDPKPYNECLSKMKETLEEINNSNMWNIVQNEKLGLISKIESTKSNVDKESAEKFLEWSEKEVDSLYGSLNSETNQSMDLLDEL